jgi:hypothetical protein
VIQVLNDGGVSLGGISQGRVSWRAETVGAWRWKFIAANYTGRAARLKPHKGFDVTAGRFLPQCGMRGPPLLTAML